MMNDDDVLLDVYDDDEGVEDDDDVQLDVYDDDEGVEDDDDVQLDVYDDDVQLDVYDDDVQLDVYDDDEGVDDQLIGATQASLRELEVQCVPKFLAVLYNNNYIS